MRASHHMTNLLINDVILNVRIGNSTGDKIQTAIGICQGDCLSALLFFLYYILPLLSNQTTTSTLQIKPVDYHRTLLSALDWAIDRDTHKVLIVPKTQMISPTYVPTNQKSTK